MCESREAPDPRSPELLAYEAETDRLRALIDFVGTFTPAIGARDEAPELGRAEAPVYDDATPIRVRKAREIALAKAFRSIGRIALLGPPIFPPEPRE